MNKTVLKLFVGLVALSLAVCAAFFSIVGLSKLFAGASMAVIVMASTLEGSKLVIASFLYQYWTQMSKVLRSYLMIAITIIAIITSIGIYGFLSGAYQTTKSKYNLTQTVTDSLSTQKTFYETSVATIKTQLASKNSQLTNLTNIRNSQETRATQLVTTNRSSRSADRSARETDLNIKSINKEIDSLNKKMVSTQDSIGKLNVLIMQVGLKNELSSELGSLVYISNVLGVTMDRVVNILIILFIIVFDPLAICMVLAFNFLNKSITGKHENITSNEIPFEEIKNETTFINDPIKNSEESITETPREQSNTTEQVLSPQTNSNEGLSEEELKTKRVFEMQERRRLKKRQQLNVYSDDSKTY